MKATLHIMVGLPGSGKTTQAKYLEKKYHLIRLTPDEWHLSLFGDDTDHQDHDIRHHHIEQVMFDLAKMHLSQGKSVILDYGFWTQTELTLYKDQWPDAF